LWIVGGQCSGKIGVIKDLTIIIIIASNSPCASVGCRNIGSTCDAFHRFKQKYRYQNTDKWLIRIDWAAASCTAARAAKQCWGGNLWVAVVIVKSCVNSLTWLLIGYSRSCAANQEPACMLTQLLTMTTTHEFPSQCDLIDIPWKQGIPIFFSFFSL